VRSKQGLEQVEVRSVQGPLWAPWPKGDPAQTLAGCGVGGAGGLPAASQAQGLIDPLHRAWQRRHNVGDWTNGVNVVLGWTVLQRGNLILLKIESFWGPTVPGQQKLRLLCIVGAKVCL